VIIIHEGELVVYTTLIKHTPM